jgi:hypothetical protein
LKAGLATCKKGVDQDLPILLPKRHRFVLPDRLAGHLLDSGDHKIGPAPAAQGCGLLQQLFFLPRHKIQGQPLPPLSLRIAGESGHD